MMGYGFGFGWWFPLIPLFAIFGRRWRRGMQEGYRHPGWPGQADARSAEQTLAERFAQGDIDEVEYRARLEVLRANRPVSQASPA